MKSPPHFNIANYGETQSYRNINNISSIENMTVPQNLPDYCNRLCDKPTVNTISQYLLKYFQLFSPNIEF